jgi:hypothetical protein
MNRLYLSLALAAWLGAASLVRAQDAPCECPCGKKVVSPTVEPVKHTRYCYDCKEEDYAYTHWVPTPILSIFCHDHCGKCDSCTEPDACHKCGHARTRKVLIKEIVTEDVPTAKCRVDRAACEPHHACQQPQNVEDTVLELKTAPAK